MTTENMLPMLAVAIPFLSVIVIPLLSDEKGNRFMVLSTFLTFLIVAAMYPSIRGGITYQYVLSEGMKFKVAFMADALSVITGLISIIVWTLASIFSVRYMAHEHAQKRYNIFSLLSLTGMLGVVFTRNLFSLYIFFEMLSVASYVMVIHEETPEATQAGLKYIFMGVCGGLLLLFSIIGTYSITGTGDLIEIAKMGSRFVGHPAVPYIFFGFIIGFGVKAGLFPLHVWLPDAHPVAPAPASALLSGVMIKAGAYGIIRTVYTIIGLGILQGHILSAVLLSFAAINVFLGSAVAMKQTEIKRMLAYSSISQIGYVVLGAALLTPLGIMGAVIHIFNHAIIKGTLFMSAGAYINQTGLRQLKDLKGIGKRMPIVTGCFTLGALSMIGFPPFNGFISKWFLVLGALQVGEVGSHPEWVGIGVVVLLLLSSFMNLLYYGPVVYGAWFGKTPADKVLDDEYSGHDAHAQHAAVQNDDPDLWMKLPLVLLGLGIIFFGIFPQLPVGLAEQASKLLFH